MAREPNAPSSCGSFRRSSEHEHRTLTIIYRNGEGLPASPSGYYRFGADEWEDLQPAAEFALAAGAQELILVGYSVGGTIALSVLYHSALAHRLRGVLLESPALDLEALIDDQATRQRPAGVPLPGALTTLAQFLAARRFAIDYRAMDYLERAEALSAPVLLFPTAT